MNVVQTNVFGISKNGGNPCTVVRNADHLSIGMMQSMAATFGFETVFILESRAKECDYRLRYFAPKHEMEMCVHATIAAVTVLVKQEECLKQSLLIETSVGVVPVHWKMEEKSVVVTVEQFKPTLQTDNPSIAEVAVALSIPENDINPLFPIKSVSTSRPKLMIPIKNSVILHNLKPNFQKLWSVCDKFKITGFYPFAVLCKNELKARQFPNQSGYDEDPATGVAASSLGVYVTLYNVCGTSQEGWNIYHIYQGETMGKPSKIQAEIEVENKKIIRTRISGNAIILQSGRIQ
ncbi:MULTISPECIES: PhzF family phenazine biosynthesis protein [unclassified Fredinandcohnia]|uniref:PhzF family phenazine biosynthesis protein n=1 Tax=unclassified Fredinandcohnia TaxID=2837514 RepID=UPI0030FDDB33